METSVTLIMELMQQLFHHSYHPQKVWWHLIQSYAGHLEQHIQIEHPKFVAFQYIFLNWISAIIPIRKSVFVVLKIIVHRMEVLICFDAPVRKYSQFIKSCINPFMYYFFLCTICINPGVPMIATLPHFYKAEQLLDGIESGLSPNKTNHELYVHLEIVNAILFNFYLLIFEKITIISSQKKKLF